MLERVREHPVDQVIVLVHDVQQDGRPRPCGKVAMHVTLDYLGGIVAETNPLPCRGCHKLLTLDDVTGDEPFVPQYKDPRLPPAGGAVLP